MFDYTYKFDLFSLFILLGIGQVLFISLIIFFKRSYRTVVNTYLSLFLIALGLLSIDVFLSYSGLILNAIYLFDFSNPLLFVVGPLHFLYIRQLLFGNNRAKYLHFVIFGIYCVYTILYYAQPADLKYNIYIYWYNVDLPAKKIMEILPIDPLGIKKYIIPLAILHWIVYGIASLIICKKYLAKNNLKLLTYEKNEIQWVRDFVFLFLFGVVIISAIKLSTILSTINYLAVTFLTIIIYVISFRLVLNSTILNFDYQKLSIIKKYKKSSLSYEMKQELLSRIRDVMERDKLYCDNLITLTKVSKQVGASNNQVSQVINECMNVNFYEMLAEYRINEAVRIYNANQNITMEDLVYRVGYNSRTAFNNAFKKIKNKPPSQFLKEQLREL